MDSRIVQWIDKEDDYKNSTFPPNRSLNHAEDFGNLGFINSIGLALFWKGFPSLFFYLKRLFQFSIFLLLAPTRIPAVEKSVGELGDDQENKQSFMMVVGPGDGVQWDWWGIC